MSIKIKAWNASDWREGPFLNLFIDEKINEAYSELLVDIKKKSMLCDLATVRYDTYSQVDYSNEFIQKYYFLKYFFGYLGEYYFIYSKLLEEWEKVDNFNILSLGSGSGTDYYGFLFSVAKKRKLSFEDTIELFSYKGIDAINWLYQPTEVNYNFETCTISNIKDIIPETNIIFFPKSLAEFSNSDCVHIKKVLNKTNFSSNNIAIINAVNDSSSSKCLGRIKKICEVFDKKYTCNDDREKYFPYAKTGAICKRNSAFQYPNEIKEDIKFLFNHCEKWKKDKDTCDEDCKDVLGQEPIITDNYFKFQILKFERK